MPSSSGRSEMSASGYGHAGDIIETVTIRHTESTHSTDSNAGRLIGMADETAARPGQGRPEESDEAARALALAEQAEAEAVAEAARARVHALRLRHAADTVRKDHASLTKPDIPTTPIDEDPLDGDPVDRDDDDSRPSRQRFPSRRGLLTGAALFAACALFGASGYILWQHRAATQERDRASEFAAAARHGVVNMTSLDYRKADEGVQRILDSATGEFRDDFEHRVKDFTTIVKESEVVTEGSVNATAVQSMTSDSAVVLVAASSKVTNAAGAQNEPRSWRLNVTVTRDADQLKLSKVEFVP